MLNEGEPLPLLTYPIQSQLTRLGVPSGRVGIAAQMVGLAQGVVNLSIPYTLQRKQFGMAVGLVCTPF